MAEETKNNPNPPTPIPTSPMPAYSVNAPKKRPPMLGSYVAFSVALFLLILVTGSAAFLFSMQHIIRHNKGHELTKHLEIERLKLESFVHKEIAIVLNMSSSPLIRRHFENPGDLQLKKMATEEINAYRRVLMGQAFWISDKDKMFYFDNQEPYRLNTELPENYWYPMTMNNTRKYNLNINYNPDLKVTNLWVNTPVFSGQDSSRAVGMLGAGIDLTSFISNIFTVYRDRAHHNKAFFYFFNKNGEITGADDIRLVAEKKNIGEKIGKSGAQVVAAAKELLPGEARTFAIHSGQAAVISIPSLDWYAAAIHPDSLDDYNMPVTVFFLAGILVVAFILILSNIFIGRLLVPLRETMTSLEAASKAKSDFLAKMSHEIRTPMNAIMGVAQVQLEKKELPEESRSAFDIVHNSSTTLLSIINDILDMSKIETGKLTLNPVEYDLPNLICDIVQLNATRIGSKPVEFKLVVSADLPLKLFGDDLRLKQVLNNILSNSFKYTDHGSVNLAISRIIDGGDAVLIFEITDTGQGIKDEDLKRIFSEYMRLNVNANRNIEGTGLGLNIAHRLTAMMGGKIDVISEYGKGSTFTVYVRQRLISGSGVIGAEYSEKLQNFNFASIKHSEERQINRERIPHGSVLIVDDVETNLVIAEMLLAPYELKIEKADSGYAAVEKIKSGKVYDVIFMDHMMPGMDGVEATGELRAQGYGGVIIALTANAIVGNREMFINNGFDNFLSKPIDVAELDALLNRYVRGKHTEEAREQPAAESAERSFTLVKMNDRFLNALRRDVEKAAATLRETAVAGDLKEYTTTVHGLKSALAAIGKSEISNQALALEMAGRNNDLDYIVNNTEEFIKALEGLIEG